MAKSFVPVAAVHSNAPPRPHTAAPPSGLLDRPYSLLIRASVALSVFGGFSLGVYLILGFAFGLPLSAGAPGLMQVHGQVQALGLVALFIMAVAVQLLPRFHAHRLDRPRWVAVGGLLLACGVVARAVGQPLEPSLVRAALVLASAGLEIVGIGVALAAFARVVRGSVQPQPNRGRSMLPATLGSSLLLALLVNLAACIELAQGGLLVPRALDEALLHAELWGVGATMILTIGGRVFPQFLLLRPTRETVAKVALWCWLVGNLAMIATWLVLGGEPRVRFVVSAVLLVAATLYVVSLRLYEHPLRESGMPHVTNPTRTWARIAFVFLLAAAAANVGISSREVWLDDAPLTMLSAARHALAQGFILPVILFMAARILPGYSGIMMRRPRLLAALIWTMFLGAALRFGAELVAGYAPGWGAVVALGGTLGAAAFVVFAWGLWRATGKAPLTVG